MRLVLSILLYVKLLFPMMMRETLHNFEIIFLFIQCVQFLATTLGTILKVRSHDCTGI